MHARASWFATLCLLGGAARASSYVVPSTMRAVRVKALAACKKPDFACFETATVKTPKPLLGEVLIRLNASSVNPSDVDLVQELGPLVHLGVDVSGAVVAVGTGVKRFKVGDRVWGMAPTGAYAEYVIMVAALTGLAPAEDAVSLNQAGTIPEVASTSLECLRKTGSLPWKNPNITIVITSGSGGTGFVAVQMAKAYGAHTIVTSTSGAENIAFVKSLGATIVTDYKKEDIFDALPNDSIDIVYDNYGAKGSADKAMPKMKGGSVYVLLPGGEDGALSKHPKPGVKQINFGLDLPTAEVLDTIKGLMESGKLKAHVEHQFRFDNVSGAFSFSASGEVVGKISVVP